MAFNITYKNQDDLSEVHRSGFKYIYDNLLPLDQSKGILLDLYADKTFNWTNTEIKLPYTKPFIAIVHHTFDTEFSENNAYNMIRSKHFKDSISNCRGIIVLSKYLQEQMKHEFNKMNISVPVFTLIHPTETCVPKFDYDRFVNNENKKLIHIGAWLRNVYFFYNLSLGKYPLSYKNIFSFNIKKESLQKVALKGIDMDNYFYSDSFVNILKNISPKLSKQIVRANCSDDNSDFLVYNKWYYQFQSFVNHMKNSVMVLDRLDNSDYDNVLTENIVFINLIDASACNTLIECVVRHTPIIINKHPAVVEVLGNSYPLYYNKEEPNGISYNYFQMNKEIDDLLNAKGLILKAHTYLKKLDKTPFTMDCFIDNLKDIIRLVD